jgi:hypothetical protein
MRLGSRRHVGRDRKAACRVGGPDISAALDRPQCLPRKAAAESLGAKSPASPPARPDGAPPQARLTDSDNVTAPVLNSSVYFLCPPPFRWTTHADGSRDATGTLRQWKLPSGCTINSILLTGLGGRVTSVAWEIPRDKFFADYFEQRPLLAKPAFPCLGSPQGSTPRN